MAPECVSLGGSTVTLALPTSYSVRYEVFTAIARSEVRALSAALGLCWGDRRSAPKASYEASYSVLVYGGQVLDELVARGISAREVVSAGALAYALIAREWVPTEPEVAAAEDFFVAPGPSTE